MKFTHHDLGSLNAGAVVVIALDGTEANVQLMDDSNFRHYKAGRGYRAVGGHYKQSPVRLVVPRGGHWHVAVDLGGFSGRVSSSVTVLRASA